VSAYRAKSGRKGVIGMVTREGDTEDDRDFIEHLFTASTHDYLMFFTNTGRAYVERVHEIPDMARASKGRNIANLLELKPGETIAALIRIVSRRARTTRTPLATAVFLFFAPGRARSRNPLWRISPTSERTASLRSDRRG